MQFDDKFQQLMVLMKEREERRIANENKAVEQRLLRSWSNQFQYQVSIFNSQQSCTHRKGAFRRGTANDFAVTTHVMPDNTVRIACMNCGWEAWNNRAFSFKWAIALRMAKNSTNTPSSSERYFRGKLPVAPFERIPFKMPNLRLEMGDKLRGNRIFAEWED